MSELLSPTCERLDWHQAAWRWFDNAMATERLPQAMLLVGGEGLGKRVFARQVVRHLLVDADDISPTQRSNRLHQLEAGSHADFRQLSPLEGKQGISVDQIRQLTAKTMLTSRYGGARVILIDPAESMNSSAANALLKCLEEPPMGTVFILVSDQPARLPVTIRSRCQTISFSAPTATDGLAWLVQSGVATEQAQLALALVGNGPLKAKALVETGVLDAFRECVACIDTLILNRGNPVSVAAQLLPDVRDAEAACQLCDWLSLLLAAILKTHLDVDSHAGGIVLSVPMKRFAKTIALSDLFQYLERVSAAKSSLLGNAGPLLTIESLLVPWSRKLRVG